MGTKGCLFAVFMALLAIAAIIPAGYAQANVKCSDGTKYFECSTTQVGYLCAYGGQLQLFIRDAQNKMTKCHCTKFPGYIEMDGVCVKTVCTIGSDSVQNGQCYDKTHQKCVNGSLVDDASACGCPGGKKVSGSVCVDNRDGCRWPNSVKCLNYQECKFDAAKPSDNGQCQVKDGCQWATYNGKSCNPDTETCNTQTGKCDKKPGACAMNSECGSGKICNLITHMCDTPASTSVNDAAPLIGGNAAILNDTSPPTSDNKGGFCCLPPIAIASGAVGMAYIGRKQEGG